MANLSDHHKLITVLLSVIGLWPYDNTWFAYVKRAAYILIVTLAIVFQVAAFVHNAEYSLNVAINFITNITFSIIFIFKYTSFLYKMKSLRQLFDTTLYHRTSITDENERKIICQGIAFTNVLTSIFASSVYIGAIGVAFYNLLPSNHNKSNEGVEFYYFTDDYKFDYISLLYIPIFTVLGITGLVGPEMVSHIFSQHTRSLFQIVRCRIRIAFVQSSGISDFDKGKLVVDKLIDATKLHRDTLKFAKQLANCLDTSYIVLMTLGVTSFSLNLLRMSELLQDQWELNEIFLQIATIICHVVYIFMANYMGQIIMDSSSDILTELNNCRWYTVSVQTQKLLLFFIQHCTKTYTVLLCGLFAPNYEGFSTLIKASFSYFAVMCSVQK